MNSNIVLCTQLPAAALWGDSCNFLYFAQQDVIYHEDYHQYMS